MAEQVMEGNATESETLIIPIEVQEDPNSTLAASVEKMMRERARMSPYCFIFRASTLFRDSKEKLFDPKMVSIGPLHHGKKELQAMEKRKLDYLEAFLGRTSVSLQTLIGQIKGCEKEIRNCYAETFEFISSDEFVRMILLDSCFVIEMLSRMYYGVGDGLLRTYQYDIELDMLLVENQLPFPVLQGTYDLAFPNSIGTPDCFLNLCLAFVRPYALGGGSRGLPMEEMSQQKHSAIKHLLDLLRKCITPSIPRENPGPYSRVEISMPKLTELEEAGMVIVPRLDHTSRLDIRYTRGVLEIPQIVISDATECMLVNLVAFEHCTYFPETYVSDYMQFMDSLIDTDKDVDILIHNGVIETRGRQPKSGNFF